MTPRFVTRRIPITPGLHVLRYVSATDAKRPPAVLVAPKPDEAAGLNLVRRKGTTVHACEPFPAALGVGMVCRGHMFDNGVIMRAVGDRMIVAPPLVMTCAQIDEMLERIGYCLDLTLADLQARGSM